MIQEQVVQRTVEEAQAIILSHFGALDVEHVVLLQALGRTLAEDIRADINVPPFANSAMDGYAVRTADLQTADGPTILTIIGEVPAGGVATEAVQPGTAMRIMTGAPLPDGADTIVPFEETDEGHTDTLLGAGKVRIFTSPPLGASVRGVGGDVRAGATVLTRHTVITPATIGVLAMVGAAKVAVYRRPRVAILATGDELVDVAERPGPGQIRNSNGYANTAQVIAAGGEPLQLPIARDTEDEVRAQLQAAIDWKADLLLTSGGVSVGDYDVVKRVLQSMGALQLWRVRMKPGKPITFGHVAGIPLLGLPGNPVSAMVCFELYGRPALLKMQGRTALFRPTIRATFADRLHDSGDRRQYVRVRVTQDGDQFVAHLTGAQGSGILSSMLGADGLMIVPEGLTDVEPGMLLDVLMLVWPETDRPETEPA